MNISDEQMLAYTQARYVIDFGAGVVVRIGADNALPERFASLLSDGYGVLLTAWNPHGVDQPLNVNRELNTRLGDRLREEGRAFVTAFGEDDAGTWREDGYFVYPLSREQATQACVDLRQNAVVTLSADGQAELLFHPSLELVSANSQHL